LIGASNSRDEFTIGAVAFSPLTDALWAKIQITLDLFGHLFPGHKDEAASMLDAYLARLAGGSTVAHTVAPRDSGGVEAMCTHVAHLETVGRKVSVR
jgi:hypothetical protein